MSKKPSANDLDALRAEIADLKARRTEIEEAPPAKADMIERVERAIEYFAGQFEPTLAGIANDGKIDYAFADHFASSESDPSHAARRAACFFTPDAVKERYLPIIDACVDAHPPGLAAAARAEAMAALDVELLAAEIAEERAIAAGEANGHVIDRRADLIPEVFFAAYDTTGAARTAMLALFDRCDEAHAAMIRTSEKFADERKEKARFIGQIVAVDRDVYAGRDEQGAPRYENRYCDEKAVIDRRFEADIKRLGAGYEIAHTRWQVLNAPCANLRDYATFRGILPYRRGTVE